MLGNSLESLVAPLGHELEKVDEFLVLPVGTTYKIVVLHGQPDLLNEKLVAFGIKFGNWGILSKNQHQNWTEFIQNLGISYRYWKTHDNLNVENVDFKPLID